MILEHQQNIELVMHTEQVGRIELVIRTGLVNHTAWAKHIEVDHHFVSLHSPKEHKRLELLHYELEFDINSSYFFHFS